jgi:hypothetical protein
MILTEKDTSENPIEILKHLDGMPVFSQMIEVLGYKGRARHVALYWEDQEVIYDDGKDDVYGDINKSAWLKYLKHPVIKGKLFPYSDFCNMKSTYGVLIDRVTSSMYAGSLSDIQFVVKKLAIINNVTSFYASKLPDSMQSKIINGETTPEDIKKLFKLYDKNENFEKTPEHIMDDWLKTFCGTH